jgi:UDP-N-acetylmuramyl pentapeptide phosphotransferase/UDP-N-acetylglucosamine-1-phosphate transferase
MAEWPWLAVAVGVGLACGVSGAAFMLARGKPPLDVPDRRRIHASPTPRGGGVGLPVAGALLLPLGLAAAAGAIERRLLWVAVLVWALPGGLLGWLDDRRPMRSRVKLAVQAACAVAAVLLGLRLDAVVVPPLPPLALGWAAVPVSALWLVWVGNLYNFMDGMDGLAAGAGALFLVGFAGWALGAGLPGHAVLAAGVAAALLGFLRYNHPPARIFMGDAGSLFVGGVLGALPLALAREDTAGIPVAASALLMGPFVWDATYTIARRALRGDPMLPHTTHLYQRLALAGWSHARVRRLYLGLAALGFVAAAALPGAAPWPAALTVAGSLLAGVALVLVVRAVERRYNRPEA